ncbi:hypothetical protein [Microbacterium sp. P04]|uniref:hypothetical protein n=1 Tax=Microbacterium sp. P04 TaxID=3366947 RepID=UPI003746F28D
MDVQTARRTLCISDQRLTVRRIESAYEVALLRLPPAATSPGGTFASTETHSSRLAEARAILLTRARRLPPRGDAVEALSLLQFFVGGLALFITAITVMVASTADYDGILSLIGIPLVALVIAVSSMVIAFLVGLPIRLVPRLRAWWLNAGEWTLIGVLVGLLAMGIAVAVAPTVVVTDAYDSYRERDVNEWALIIAWSLFTFSVAHFVWPRRWST